MKMSKHIELIGTYLHNIDNSKSSLAVKLRNMQREIHWKDTPYGNWKQFCKEEVHLSSAAVSIYLRTAKLAEGKNFSLNEMDLIVTKIGWERFRIGLTKLGDNEKPSVAEFIKMFKNLNLDEKTNYASEDNGTETFTFILPKEAAAILTNELLINGMRVCSKTRSNMSGAMIKVIEEIAKNSEK